LIAKGPFDHRFVGHMDHDKWIALEERLREVEENDFIDLVLAIEVCLVPNIMVLKDFKVLNFMKYTGIQCPNTNLWSYCNKMDEVNHNDKILIYFFQDSLIGSTLS